MKTIYLLIMCLLSSITVYAQTTTLYTPNGSAIEPSIRDEFTPEQINQITNQYKADYGAENVLAPASRKYNCHSYAWSITEGGTQKVWMNQYDGLGNPNVWKYWTDGSYVAVAENDTEKIFYYNGDHSAVKSKTVAGKYESKWGAAPLMRHSPTEGPSIYNMDYRRYYKKAAPPPHISGSTTVCDQATYTIENLPPGATVQWSASYNKLQLLSGQGSGMAIFKKRTNGADMIRAKITYNNNSIDVTPLGVYFGTTVIQNIMGPQRTPNEQEARYEAFIISGGSMPTHYEWILNPKGRNSVYPSGRFVYIAFYDAGTYQLVFRATNSCGVGEYSATTLNVYNSSKSNGEQVLLYPNPATDMVTVELQELEPESRILSLPRSPDVYEIQLWNASVMLKRFTTDRTEYQIPVSGLPAGVYFVRVIKDGQTYTKKLIKR